MLVVAVPDAPGQPPLPNVKRERDLVLQAFADRHIVLQDQAAVGTAVKTAMGTHPYVHFSCHGTQDLMDPSRGGLALQDGILTIGDLAARQHPGEFAFLSACKTATGGLAVPDESLTLVAALHYTGYRHVVGTMWSVYDSVAAEVAGSVYTALTDAGTFRPGGTARALHEAVRNLRDLHRMPPSAWSMFIHTGP